MAGIRAVLFDFGGVLAEEGFRQGLMAIGRAHGLDPDEVFRIGRRAAFEGGYTTGEASERQYWEAFRNATGIRASDEELRDEILSRFVLRPKMFRLVRKAKEAGYIVAVLSDQTNWLEELDEKGRFLRLFDHVYNSFRLGKSKADPTVFTDVCGMLGIRPEEALFIDDSEGNVRRAGEAGLNAILFTSIEGFEQALKPFLKIT